MKICKTVSFLLVVLILNSCSHTFTAKKAIENNCGEPSANYKSINFSDFKPSGYMKDFTKLFQIYLENSRAIDLDYESRCMVTDTVYTALNNNKNYDSLTWENKEESSRGKVIIFLTRNYATKICRDYYSYIYKKNKKFIYSGTACNGYNLREDNLSKVGNWIFYKYTDDQLSGVDIDKNWGYVDRLHPELIRKYNENWSICWGKKIKNKEPWRCR